jgi:hypothetical protein
MRNIEQLIAASRRSTGNTDFSDTAGVQDEEFLQAFNDAQEEIHSLINLTFPAILMAEKVIQLSSNVASYPVPSNCYMGTRIDHVEHSPSGLLQDFYPIRKGAPRERLNGQSGNPAFYIRQGSEIILQPVPQGGGSIRVTYQKAVPVLEKRRGTVSSVTLSSNQITDLYLDTTVLLDDTSLVEQNYITIVDKNGQIKMQGIPVDSINSGTGQVIVSAGFTFEAGETIAPGDFALRGKYASTHSELPDLCEKYLLEYANMRIFVRDSSTDQAEVSALMSKIEATLKAAFSEPTNDPDSIPIIDPQYLGYDV